MSVAELHVIAASEGEGGAPDVLGPAAPFVIGTVTAVPPVVFACVPTERAPSKNAAGVADVAKVAA